jgi:hypothetical protein
MSSKSAPVVGAAGACLIEGADREFTPRQRPALIAVDDREFGSEARRESRYHVGADAPQRRTSTSASATRRASSTKSGSPAIACAMTSTSAAKTGSDGTGIPRPWRRAFLADTARPAAVFGPVLRRLLARLACSTTSRHRDDQRLLVGKTIRICSLFPRNKRVGKRLFAGAPLLDGDEGAMTVIVDDRNVEP